MTERDSAQSHLRLSALSRSAPIPVSIVADAGLRGDVARALGLDALRKLRFEGTLHPQGKRDWHLTAQLGATVVQPCVVTGAPVTTRIDADVVRSYRADFRPPEAADVEMPEDDTQDPLPETLDLIAVLSEALSLEIPDYPRAANAGTDAVVVGPPGVAPMRPEDARPFAGLAQLRDKLGGSPAPSPGTASGDDAGED